MLVLISAKDMVSKSQEEAGKSKKRSIASIYKLCGFMGRNKIAGEQIFNNLAALMKSLQYLTQTHLAKEPFP